MIKLSERLATAASLVSEGNKLADVGTDHGYVPICLVLEKKIPGAVAMDINRGPLVRAREHIRQYGLETYIQTRLSDGVSALAPGEADSILAAGMGGGLVMHILSEGQEVCRKAKELILQPQSELMRVRLFLWENGYCVDDEAMVKDGGKYYPMMRVHYAPEKRGARPSECEACYGRLLLEQRHPMLREYLERERRTLNGILSGLHQTAQTPEVAQRTAEVEHLLAVNAEALSQDGSAV